jgi:hypothetical protein
MKKVFLVLTLATLEFASLAAAQSKDPSKRPSPPATASCSFADGKTITTDYSSPRAKGRKIFGGLVPYGEVWRLGANDATTLVTKADLTIDGKDVPAGNYTLFALPTADKWTLIVSKKTGEWGIPYPDGEDLTRADMTVSHLSKPVENFTISYDAKGKSCTLNAEWENTKASIVIIEK